MIYKFYFYKEIVWAENCTAHWKQAHVCCQRGPLALSGLRAPHPTPPFRFPPLPSRHLSTFTFPLLPPFRSRSP